MNRCVTATSFRAFVPLCRQYKLPTPDRRISMKSLVIVLALSASLAASAGASTPDATERFATRPPAAWSDADPADSLWRAARRALDQKDYEAAARMYDVIASRYPRSDYAPDALYWKGFALYRSGDL